VAPAASPGGEAGPLNLVRIGAEADDPAWPEDPWLAGSRRPDRRLLVIGGVVLAGLLAVASTAWLVGTNQPQAGHAPASHPSRPSQLGSGQAQPSQALSGHPVPSLSPTHQPAPARTGTSPAQTGQSGPGKTGHGQAGQGGPGQSGPGRTGSHPGTSRSGTGRSSTGHSSPGHTSASPTSTPRPAASQTRSHRTGPGQSGTSGTGNGQHGPGQPVTGPTAAPTSPGQPGSGQSGPGQSGPGQSGPGQSGPGQSNPGRSGSGRSGHSRTGTSRSTTPVPHPHRSPPASRGSGRTRRPGHGSVSIGPGLAGRADVRRVTALLDRYFAAVNHRDYQAYAHLFAQRHLTPRQFTWGYRTSHDSKAMLVGVGPLEGGLKATVTFTSHQDPAGSPDHSSCIDWRITLFLHRAGPAYRIGMPPPGYRAALHACRFAPRPPAQGHSGRRSPGHASSPHQRSKHQGRKNR
jgi:hypothetical protein